MGLFDRFKPKKKPSPQPEVPFQPGRIPACSVFLTGTT